ncbi:MAG: MFS transporter [Phycisphaerales bacterium]
MTDAVPEVSVSPLRDRVFRALWVAALASNIGSGAHDLAAAWKMTELTEGRSQLLVASLQTAVAVPSFVLAIPAGALADVVDRRKLLIVMQLASAVCAGLLAVMARGGVLLPGVLLLFTVMLGIAAAVGNPAWQTLMSALVRPERIAEASALNSLSMNLARAIGPAIGGFVVASLGGPATAFAINGASFAVIGWVLWRTPVKKKAEGGGGGAPGERLIGAIRAGWRYVRHSAPMRAVLVRTTSFVLPVSALWALLPLVARDELGLGAAGYGLLMGFFGGGAVAGALLFPLFRKKVSYNVMAAVSTVAMAGCMATLAVVSPTVVGRSCASVAMAIGGAAWVTVVMCSNSSSQAGTPPWVRGRALSWYFTMHFGCMAGGSALWGALAQVLPVRVYGDPAAWNLSSVDATLLVAAGFALLGLTTLQRWRFVPLVVSSHEKGAWPDPVLGRAIGADDGPVIITVEYVVEVENAEAFKRAMGPVSVTRYRDGAINWMLSQDVEDPRRWLEVFIAESWAEHLRQHDRVTKADECVQGAARAFHVGEKRPVVRHSIAAAVRGDADRA